LLAAYFGLTVFAVYPVQAQAPPPSGSKTLVPPSPARRATEDLLSELSVQLNDFRKADVLLANVLDMAGELLGATLQPVGPTLRAQLDLPAGAGLLVAQIRSDGASAHAGLQLNDILLWLADKPLASVEDLTKGLKAAGDSPVPLKLLRAGKLMTIQVRPCYRVTLGPVVEQKNEYYIGVSIDPADDALRAQLGLPASQGVVVTDLVSGSPAEKAGVKTHDIILELGGSPVATAEALASRVQATRDKPTTLTILRGGKPITIEVTAAVRKVEASQPQESLLLWTTRPQALLRYADRYADVVNHAHPDAATKVWALTEGGEDVRQRLDRLEKEMQALRATLDKLNDTLKGMKRD
jgi:serine protease Do